MVSAITKLWAKKLEDGTKTWGEVPESREKDVEAILQSDVGAGKITEQKYMKITGHMFAVEE